MTTISIKGAIIPRDYGWIYDLFGMDYTTPEQFKAQLDAADDSVVVEINSPGGFVTAGSEIYESIRAFAGEIECRVVGQAASAASVIACACKSSISPMGTLFIHNCIGRADGNHNDMRQAAQAMESIDENIMSVYRAKTGMTDEEIYGLMEENTTFSAQRAVELGFIDRITESVADATGLSAGIAAASGGFIDPMTIDADRLAALREAYEGIRLRQVKGGESMEFENLRDEAEEVEIKEAEAEESEEIEEAAEEAAEEEIEDQAEEAAESDADEVDEETDEAEAIEAEPEASDDLEDAYERGVMAERERIAGILGIASKVPEAMLSAALFTEPISAEQLALAAMKAEEADRTGYMDKARADVAASKSAEVAAAVTDNTADAADEQNALVAKVNERFEK